MTVDVVQIRPPRFKDAPDLAAAYEEAWRNAYQGIIPHLSLERMADRTTNIAERVIFKVSGDVIELNP